MKRRDFIKTAPLAALPVVLSGMSIQALGASPMLAALAASAAANDHVLVIIQVVGGNDGLNTVIPLDQYSALSAARSNIMIPSGQVLALTGSTVTGLHPSMTGLQQMYNNGFLKIVQSVGYPNPSFSHFKATDIWVTAEDSNQTLTTGWNGRYLNYEYPNFPAGYPNTTMPDPLAIEIGTSLSPVFQGPSAAMAMAVTDPSSIYNLANGIQSSAPATPAGTELTYIREVAQQTNQYATVLATAYNAGSTTPSLYPTGSKLAGALQAVAKLISGGLKTKIYMVSTANDGTFDTHHSQVVSGATTTGTHAGLLQNLSDCIKGFHDDLTASGSADRVLGMTFSEFGRRILSNASVGTDHGAAAPLFIFGNKVLSGILGTNPQLPSAATVNDNIPMQYDFRSVYASILQDWLCVPKPDIDSVILLQNFQALPLIDATDCTTALHDINSKAGVTLISNSPNPFTTSTNITFTTAGGHTLVQVFDGSGHLLRNLIDQDMKAGDYRVTFENENYSTGVYYARFQNGVIQQVRTMAIAR
ncbi:MAG: hypothetical protein JWO03_560 [Bacteroidetes bacterium]|nr:hypothetical protein [Bacteroidota bacterium]